MTGSPVLAQSYDWDSFIRWSAWAEVERHINSRGVCAGVGGARGSGKSWLLRHAVEEADKRDDGIGIYFPSPSAYDASVFLSGLCLALATRVESKLRPPQLIATAVLEIMNKRSVQIGSSFVAVVFVILYLQGSGYALPQQLLYGAAAALAVYLYVSIPSWMRTRRLDRNPRSRLYLKSLAVQRWIQFASASKTSSEFAMEAGKGLLAKGKVSQEMALSERPVTELALVTEFRSMAEELAALKLRTVVAIDELDKIGSVDEVRKLLRSVKGVLDPAGVVLLVSVSDEAVTHLGLGGLRGRDEISSSFNSMIVVPPLSREEVRTLVSHLLGEHNDQVADALWVLTGGNQREAVRLLDECLLSCAAGDLTPETCVQIASRTECRELLRALVTDSKVGEAQKVNVYRLVEGWAGAGSPSRDEVLSYWTPDWSRVVGWPEGVSEDWRRFLAREALRQETKAVISEYEAERLFSLSEAFRISQHSATVARHLLSAEEPKPGLLARMKLRCDLLSHLGRSAATFSA